MIRVLIVDDHEIVAQGLSLVLEAKGDISVVGKARSITEARAICTSVSPHVIVLDLRLPDSRGVEEIPVFKSLLPLVKVVVLTGYGAGMQAQAKEMGADAFLTKELASDQIATTIRSLLPNFGKPAEPKDRLSPREKEIARLVSQGLSNGEVAAALSISINTVKTHLAKTLEKLGVRDRVALARYWREQGHD